MQFGIITLFPEFFKSFAEIGVFGRAVEMGWIQLHYWNPRDFTIDKHHTVDDRPYGGGPGMVLLAEPIEKAILAAKQVLKANSRVIYLTPQGARLEQSILKRLVCEEQLILLAGRYEGIDERLLTRTVDEEISIGDYVCSGGELPAMVLMDAIARLIPGVLGHAESPQKDSFFEGLLDHPHYTRPEVYQGHSVPETLLSGNHTAIARWRLKEALGRTWKRRPDLLAQLALTEEQKALLNEYRTGVE